MKKVRTRFAPSPTGYAHVGNLRTALFTYLTAKHADGEFILRLEDTDKNREVADADSYILNAIKRLGLDYSEGPDIGGPYAPYRQSERLDIYKTWAEKLIASGRAYADPYTPKEMQVFRDEAAKDKKAFRYRDHRPSNPPKWDGTQPLRFKSDPKDYTWEDAIMGELSAGADAIDDFVLMKSDGYPTYNFAHIVDDHEMKITHVIRGQEYVSSIPNYLNLYEAFDINPPVLAHMPHILNETGNKKLGKRDGAKDAMEYLDKEGILVEALDNFLASMGWNDGTEQEIFSMKELIDKFTLDRVGRSGARFDEKRLIWMNSQWIKKLSLDELYKRAEPYWGKNGKKAPEKVKRQVLMVVQDRLKTLKDLPNLSEYFFIRPQADWAMVEENKQLKKLDHSTQIALLSDVRKKLSKLSAKDFKNTAKLQEELNELLVAMEQKPPILFGLIRFTLTWAIFSPGLPETMKLLGKRETLRRIDIAIKILKDYGDKNPFMLRFMLRSMLKLRDKIWRSEKDSK